MAKITISRLFEVSKYLTTDAGRELSDALTYLSEFVEVTVRNLTKGLTFGDNFDTTIKEITVRPDAETVILKGERKRVREVVVRRVIDDTYYATNSFGWKYNPQGEVLVKIGFADSPPATQDIKLEVMMHFG